MPTRRPAWRASKVSAVAAAEARSSGITTASTAARAECLETAAFQLARWSDATVVTTVSSPEKANLAARAGADHVLDYTRQDVVAEVRAIAPHGVHTVVEVSPAVNAAVDAQVLALHGSVAVYANNGGDEVTIPIRPSMAPNVRWQFVLVYDAPHDWRARALDDVSAAVMDGAVRAGAEAGLPLHHFPLEETSAAHAAVEDGAVGKVLIDVAD